MDEDTRKAAKAQLTRLKADLDDIAEGMPGVALTLEEEAIFSARILKVRALLTRAELNASRRHRLAAIDYAPAQAPAEAGVFNIQPPRPDDVEGDVAGYVEAAAFALADESR